MKTPHAMLALILAAGATAARADFTIEPPIMHSAGPLGNAGNSVYLYTYTGPDAVVTGGQFGGAISSIIQGTTIAEARWNIRNTRFGTTGSVSFFHNLGYFENSVLVTGNLGGGMVLKTGDVLRIETHEASSAADDGPGTDAVWNNVAWTFETAAIEDLGNFDDLSTIRTSGGGGAFGTDTEIAMFNSDGLLLRFNDDYGGTSGSGFGGLSLADGTYYLTVTPYDTTFANGLIRPGFWGTGEFTLAFNGATVDAATLGMYSTLWYRFTVGATPPCDPDFTCDGNVDQDDVACLIDEVAGNPGCACQDADYNQDGNVDQDDVSALINVIAGGTCP